MTYLNIGDTAPNFTLQDQNDAPVSLTDYAGKWLVLYFYPKALTPGCTTQACSLRDGLKELEALGATAVGVSGDEPKKLKNFEEKEGLNFTLIGDPEHTMLEAYGTWQEKSMYGRKYMGVMRMTYIIDPQGKIAYVMPKVSPSSHLDEVITWLKENAV